MKLQPGHLYTVNVTDRGSGTVKAIRQDIHGLVDSTIMHGRFKVRCVPGRLRVDGDMLCFYAGDGHVSVKPLELSGDDDRQTA